MPPSYWSRIIGDALDVDAENNRAGSVTIYHKAMSHNERVNMFSRQYVAPDVRSNVVFSELSALMLPYLTQHELDPQDVNQAWTADRHLHHAVPSHPDKKSLCRCCKAMSHTFGRGSCTLCEMAWRLSCVNVALKDNVHANNQSMPRWWWKWTPEHLAARNRHGRNRYGRNQTGAAISHQTLTSNQSRQEQTGA